MKLMVELEGKTVQLAGCQYVLWAACGCPTGVSLASEDRPEPVVTEDDAWRMFFPLKRERDRAQRNGLRMELMTHDRYSREVYPLMLERSCPHKGTRSGDVPQRDTTTVTLQRVDPGRDRGLLLEAAERVIDGQAATCTFVQRRVRVGFAKGARLLELLEDAGVVSPFPPGRSARRTVLVPREERDAALKALRSLTVELTDA